MADSAKTFDVREDAEQEKKGQEVMELLVAAGYFRARIKVCLGTNRFQGSIEILVVIVISIYLNLSHNFGIRNTINLGHKDTPRIP